MLICAIIILIIIIIFVCTLRKESNKQPSTNKENVQSATQILYWPEDPQKYTLDLDGHRLLHYNGNEDILYVPMGTYIIGNNDEQIKEGEKWDTVYIPKSVTQIHDFALAFVESVQYEGSEEEFKQIKCNYKYNFYTGFIPNWAKDLPNPEYSKVKQVKFCYNVNIPELYKASEEQWKNIKQ